MGEMDDLVRKANEAKAQAAQAQENSTKRRAEYVDALNTLFKDIAYWMQGLIQAGMAKTSLGTVMAADWFGEFSAPEMQLTINNHHVRLVPISWQIIGWRGGSLVLHIDPNIEKAVAQKEGGWVIFDNNNLQGTPEPLNRDSFAKAIKFLFP